MNYISTRGARLGSFSDILLMGLAPDGGLALPEHYPQIDRATLDAWRGLDYPALAFEIIRLFADDIPADDLKRLVFATYRAEVDMLTLDKGPMGIVGRSLVVHADPDDYRSQPAGNSGKRVACGVIAGV